MLPRRNALLVKNLCTACEGQVPQRRTTARYTDPTADRPPVSSHVDLLITCAARGLAFL